MREIAIEIDQEVTLMNSERMVTGKIADIDPTQDAKGKPLTIVKISFPGLVDTQDKDLLFIGHQPIPGVKLINRKENRVDSGTITIFDILGSSKDSNDGVSQ